MGVFDYQSDRHCAKTLAMFDNLHVCLITSQIDTAPKLPFWDERAGTRLITSQIDTAPKPATLRFLSSLV